MEPLKLIIENFCGHEYSEIDFGKFSVALIIGKLKGNEKTSNGVGKSTIFAAIKYVLFNESEFSKIEKIIRHGCDSCKVSFEFKSDNSIYKIIRTRSKKAGADLRLFRFANDVWEDTTQRKASDTEQELFKLIKMNCKTFCNSVLFSQAEVLTGLAALTPGARKLIMKDAMQLGVYSVFEKAAKKKTVDITKDIDKEKVIISTVGDPNEDIKKIDAALNEITTLVEAKSSELNIKVEKYDQNKTALTDIENKIDSIEQKTSEAYQNYRSLQQEISTIKTSIGELNTKSSKIKKVEQQITEQLAQIKKSSSKYDNYDFDQITSLKDQVSRTVALLMEKKINYKNIASDLEKQNIPMPEDAMCKHCKQPITKEHRQVCKKNNDIEIAKTKQQLTALKSTIEVLMSDEKKYKENLKQLESNLEIVSKAQQVASSKEKELESVCIMLAEYEGLHKKENSKFETKMVELDGVKKFLSDNNAKEVVKLKVDKENINKSLLLLDVEVKTQLEEVNEIKRKQAVLFDRRSERSKDIEKLLQLNKNILDLEKKYHIHQLAVQGFSSYGIPAMITHTILDDFQIETNNFLTQLKPGMQTQFLIIKDRSDGDKEDTLDIRYTLNGYDLEYAQLSGAQKLIASLCLKLGLSSVIKKRLGIDMKMLLIDEVDQSLDDGHLEDFDEAIKRLQNEFKIMIITHNKELKDKFSTAIVVEQDENMVSRAEVCNAW